MGGGFLGILHNNVAKGSIIYSQFPNKKKKAVITIVAEKLAVGGKYS